MRVSNITFHGAYNYGSVLQSYALQEFIKNLCNDNDIQLDYRILNYRPIIQKELYGVAPATTIRRKLKRALEVPYKYQINAKREKFESFISEFLNVTEEINDDEKLMNWANRSDLFISGSDQIWNIRSLDFSFSYLCEFTRKSKISYAASLGPIDIDWSLYDKERYISALKKYSSISVREKRSKRMIDDLMGEDICEVHVDPTLLLTVDDWRKIQSEYIYNEGKYILLYCLEPTRNQIKVANLFSRKLRLPIVITGYRNKVDYLNNFVKCYDAGPLDFLSLIDNAEFVLTSSFHGTVFSLLYNKSFCTIGGTSDNRISNLLEQLGMERHLFDNSKSMEEYFSDYKNDQFIRNYLKTEQARSAEYLIKALKI